MLSFLIGFMGTGKTTLGKAVAESANRRFVDLDHFIESVEKRTIREIFAEEGEDYFRQLEQDSLRKLAEIAPEDTLIACGGGTPCYGDNMKLMNELGQTIYLKTSPEVLTERLRLQKEERPLIRAIPDEELIHFIRNLLTEREQFYLQATHILDGNRLTIDGLLELIIR